MTNQTEQGAAKRERTPTDFALERAEYMAGRAERLLDAVNAAAELRVRLAESDDVSDDEERDAECDVDEAMRALRNEIGQFRTRRDRAVSQQDGAAFEAWLGGRRGLLFQNTEAGLLAAFQGGRGTVAVSTPEGYTSDGWAVTRTINGVALTAPDGTKWGFGEAIPAGGADYYVREFLLAIAAAATPAATPGDSHAT